MPEIIINSDGSLVVSRGTPSENQFFSDLLQDLLSPEQMQEIRTFFAFSTGNERIVGDSNLCG